MTEPLAAPALRAALAALDLRLESASGAHVFNGDKAIEDLAHSLLFRGIVAAPVTPTLVGTFAHHDAMGCCDPKTTEHLWQSLEPLINGLLAELAESPLPGARYAHDVVRRRLIGQPGDPI